MGGCQQYSGWRRCSCCCSGVKAGCGGDGWCVSLCPDALWPGWRGGVVTVPTPRLFPRDRSSTVVPIRIGSPIHPSSSCRRVGGGGGRDVVAPTAWLGVPWERALPLLTQLPVPWVTQDCRWGGAASSPPCPAAVLTRPFGSALSSCSSPAPAPDPAPLAPRSSHPADPPPLWDAAHRPRRHQQRLGAAGTLRGAGSPGPAPCQR